MALTLAVTPSGAAAVAETIEVQAQLESLVIHDPARVTVKEGLFQADVDPLAPPAEPFDSFDGGTVTGYQYWYNATVVRNPQTGDVEWRREENLQRAEIEFSPTRIELLRATEKPQIRAYVRALRGFTFDEARGVELSSLTPLTDLGQTQASLATQSDHFREFDDVPESSGGLALRPRALSGFGTVGFLVDGWHLRLSDDERSIEVETGVRADGGTRVGMGGVEHEVYTFVVLTVRGARHDFAEGVGPWVGYAPAPQFGWDGAADLRVYHGDLNVPRASIPLNQNQFRLEGRFNADAQFGPDAALSGATFHAAGTGTSSAFVPLASVTGPIDVAQQAGLWSSLALTAAALGLFGVHALRRPRGSAAAHAREAPPTEAAPAAQGIESLAERAKKQPLDGEAQFQLGVELMRQGDADAGLRYLDRSIRLHPGTLLRLLEDPEFAPIRDRHEVRRLLGRYHREQQRTVWAGYA